MNHAATLWLCVDNSCNDSLTRRSFAKSSSSTYRFDGMRLRRTHCSIALREISSRGAKTSGPPSRSMIVAGFAIGGRHGTPCSRLQELFVPHAPLNLFLANDNAERVRNRAGMAVLDPDKISETAFLRFRELMTDMGWRDDTAIKNLYREIGRPLGQTEKSIKMWFDRQSIPGGQIFNVSLTFGINAEWLAGTSSLSKEEATDPHGIYGREMDRVREAQRKRRA